MADNDKLNEALAGILGNSELMEKIKSVAGSVNSEETAHNNAESGEKTSDLSNSSQITPDMLQKLPGIIELLSPMLGSGTASSGGASHLMKPFKHEKLLSALKPYLNKTRCDSIDKITQITHLTETLEKAAPLIMPKNNDK